MRARTTALTAACLALAPAAGPPAAAGASAAPATASAAGSAPTPGPATAREATGPDAEALPAAIAGLPDQDATAALVRVGGTDGTWRGSAGVPRLTPPPGPLFEHASGRRTPRPRVVRPSTRGRESGYVRALVMLSRPGTSSRA
ncbi:hypothetical protein [Streptomyces spiralis]|uniref:hypothetical protein n=1 Tax=Streptomyces spiralis TaxID=66376 RepID=UPI0036ABD3E1